MQRYEAFGKKRSLAAWSRDPRCMVSYTGLRKRVLEKGMAVEAALAAPSQLPGPARDTTHDADIRRAAEAGRTITETAVELGLSGNTVWRVARRLGLTFTTRMQRNVKRDAAITARYIAGEPIAALAKEYGVDQGLICRIAQKGGAPRRLVYRHCHSRLPYQQVR